MSLPELGQHDLGVDELSCVRFGDRRLELGVQGGPFLVVEQIAAAREDLVRCTRRQGLPTA